MIIGITGPMGSGKSTVMEPLKKIGYQIITLSDMIREECDRRGVPQERENMMDIGQSLRQEFGAGILAERALQKIEKNEIEKGIVDGIRNPAEVEALRYYPNFILIANTAPEDVIIERILSRKRTDDTLDAEVIRKKLRREMGEGEPLDGQQVGKCMEMADYIFENIMGYDKVESEFMKFYDKIRFTLND